MTYFVYQRTELYEDKSKINNSRQYCNGVKRIVQLVVRSGNELIVSYIFLFVVGSIVGLGFDTIAAFVAPFDFDFMKACDFHPNESQTANGTVCISFNQ